MPVAALVLYAVWFVIAFGVRTVVALRRTGDSGWRGLAAPPFSLGWCAGVLFTVALVVGLAAPVADIAGLDPITSAEGVSWIGVLLAGAGIGLTLAAQISMGDSWRIGVDERERTAHVTDGAFALARNPIFTAMLITAVGLTLMVPNVVAVVGLVALVVALELQVRGVEEPYLAEVHGHAYRDYAARTGRFLPWLGRVPTGSARTQPSA
jgi:protein-S-isoprenylcysteine O-methyltransferase Ste14